VTKRLVVYAEGQTEELFVNRILRNHLALHGVTVERPVLAATSREATGLAVLSSASRYSARNPVTAFEASSRRASWPRVASNHLTSGSARNHVSCLLA